MPGGHLQLTFYGVQDLYLTGNPQITFFKTVYRRYTYFSMESIRVDFDGATADKYLSVDSNIELRCKIPRHGDLITNIYFVCTLPDIYSFTDFEHILNGTDSGIQDKDESGWPDITGGTRSLYPISTDFQWISNIGFNMIESVSISIGDNIIDTQYGEWLSIWNEIYNTDKAVHNKLIGHQHDLYEPKSGSQSDRIFWGHGSLHYPYIYPTLEGSKLYVPLNFWFNRSPGLALPLIALQYSEVHLNFKLRKVLDLYTIHRLADRGEPPYLTTSGMRNKPVSGVLEDNIGLFLRPLSYDELKSPPSSASVTYLDIQPYLEVNYIFLSQDERTKFANMTHEYIIETTSRTVANGYYNNTKVELDINHPVKELIWVAKRDDLEELNDWNNYTNWIHERFSPWTSTTKAIPVTNIAFHTDMVDTGATMALHDGTTYTGLGSTFGEHLEFGTPINSMGFGSQTRTDYFSTLRIGPRANGERFFPDMNDIYIHGTSNLYLENLRRDIITKCKITFNGIDRIQFKDAAYFKYVQRYQHYRKEDAVPTGKEGIHVYSFALNGQELQPSGSCNMSKIGKIHIWFEVNPPPKKLNGDYYYGYNFHIYSTNYNVLRIMGGMAGLRYSN